MECEYFDGMWIFWWNVNILMECEYCDGMGSNIIMECEYCDGMRIL